MVHPAVLFICVPAWVVWWASLENNAFGENGTRALVLVIKQFPGALANLSGVSLATADPSLPMELRDGENGPIIKYYKANAH